MRFLCDFSCSSCELVGGGVYLLLGVDEDRAVQSARWWCCIYLMELGVRVGCRESPQKMSGHLTDSSFHYSRKIIQKNYEYGCIWPLYWHLGIWSCPICKWVSLLYRWISSMSYLLMPSNAAAYWDMSHRRVVTNHMWSWDDVVRTLPTLGKSISNICGACPTDHVWRAMDRVKNLKKQRAFYGSCFKHFTFYGSCFKFIRKEGWRLFIHWHIIGLKRRMIDSIGACPV